MHGCTVTELELTNQHRLFSHALMMCSATWKVYCTPCLLENTIDRIQIITKLKINMFNLIYVTI